MQTVSKTGGHLSSNLGVVELTVALHKMFDTPATGSSGMWGISVILIAADRPLWPVRYLRQTGGISGFPKPEESEYDTFIAGHSSTAVSAANGMAKAKTLSGDGGYVVAVLGDGRSDRWTGL